ncbi:MAG: VOC family protein [Thermoleophilia bacterium]
MGQVTGIDTVFYQVCNMDRSVTFYRDTLGLPLARREGNDWAEFDAGAINLALSGELAVAPQRGGATVVLRVEGIDEIAASLKAAGTVVGSVDDLGGARMVDVYDPDGNQVVLMEPTAE